MPALDCSANHKNLILCGKTIEGTICIAFIYAVLELLFIINDLVLFSICSHGTIL